MGTNRVFNTSLKFLISLSLLILNLFFMAIPTHAAVLAEQTQNYSYDLSVWETIQELGDNLSGRMGTLTFRVSTNKSNIEQFDFTALNTRLYDKTNDTSIIGCFPSVNLQDRLRGLIFKTNGVPEGFEDVSIDFSCRNYDFIAGHKYLIRISNANAAAFGGSRIQFATSPYGTGSNDYFPFGGLRYAFDNAFCNALTYIWNSPVANSACNIFTNPKDDLYFKITDTPPNQEEVKTPLILIPGIGGSELKVMENTKWSKDNGHGGLYTRDYSAEEKVWVNDGEAAKFGNDDYFDVLRMKGDGVNSEANIGIDDSIVARAYGQTLEFFENNGYILNQDLFVFPYDWRKDISLTSPLLDQKIQQIKQQTGSEKVDIVAHSMGGLVARNYISDPIKAQNIRKLFTLGTPHLGSVKFLKALSNGDCLILEIGPFCLAIAPSELKDVIQNMVSGYQLAPSQEYFNFYSDEDNLHPFPYKTEVGPLNYLQIKNLFTNYGHNTSLFNPSEIFHSIDSNLANTNGVEVINIAGSGKPTLGQISEIKALSLFGTDETKEDIRIINGDDTVPLFSASLSDPSKNLSLLGSARIFYTNQGHGELVTDGSALKLVKNILNGSSELPSGVSDKPYPLPLIYRIFSVHSPVNIHVYDSAGNHTGPTPDGDFEANIPGSSYDSLGDAKFVYVPDGGVYTVKFEATGEGSFDFKIRKFEEDSVTEQILYKDIPLIDSTKGELGFNTLSPKVPELKIDKEGDGIIDTVYDPTSILNGKIINDSTPPKTVITTSGTAGLNAWYKSDVLVTLNSQDEEGGSGIYQTQYTLDNGATINTYNRPFMVSKEDINKLKVRSIDKAGNTENPKELEIKIDKTSPEVKVYVDQDKTDLVVAGVDNNPTTVISEPNTETKKKDDVIYKVTDTAGNVTKLDVRERDKDKKDRFRIDSIQYNDQAPIVLDNNYFNVSYIGKKEKLNVDEQNFELKKEVKIRIKYDSKKNESTVITKEPKEEKVKEIKKGLILLQLLTNKGNLETSY